MTSFTRTSIYTHFQTKEEIFLALFEREYSAWVAGLNAILEYERLDKKQLAEELAKSLQKRVLLLKILSGNLYDREENSRPERLASFKKAYGDSEEAVRSLVEKFCPERDLRKRQDFILTFFSFLHGIYPYAFATEKQKKAMDEAGVYYELHTIYELAYQGLLRFFGVS